MNLGCVYVNAYESMNVYGLRRSIMVSMKDVLNESFTCVLVCSFNDFLELKELEEVGLSFIIKIGDFAVKNNMSSVKPGSIRPLCGSFWTFQ